MQSQETIFAAVEAIKGTDEYQQIEGARAFMQSVENSRKKLYDLPEPETEEAENERAQEYANLSEDTGRAKDALGDAIAYLGHYEQAAAVCEAARPILMAAEAIYLSQNDVVASRFKLSVQDSLSLAIAASSAVLEQPPSQVEIVGKAKVDADVSGTVATYPDGA